MPALIALLLAIAGLVQPAGQPAQIPATATTAPSTDIFLGTLSLDGDVASVTNVKNVTNREGYDNQPMFEPGGGAFLYTSGDGKQTDIHRFDIATGQSRRVTDTPESEFSATRLPSGDGFSAIRQSATAQLLWRYGADGSSKGAILEKIQPVGYHAWIDEHHVGLFVLGGGGAPPTLRLADVREGSFKTLGATPGRSLHKVPGRRAVSFVNKVKPDMWVIELHDLDSGEFSRLVQTRPGREDYAWTPDRRLVMGDGSTLYQARPGGPWTGIANLSAAGVGTISRIAVSDDGKRIAIVGAKETPGSAHQLR